MSIDSPAFRDSILAKLGSRKPPAPQSQGWAQPPIAPRQPPASLPNWVPPIAASNAADSGAAEGTQSAGSPSGAATRAEALTELIEEYLSGCAARGLSAYTLRNYRTTLGQWATHCAERVHGEPSRQDVRHYLQLRAEAGISVVVRYGELVVIRGFYHWAKQVHGRPDITVALPLPKLPELLPRHLTEEQCRLLCEAEPLGTPERALMEFLYATGARVAEAVKLRWTDIDFEGKWANLHGKGSKERQVPFGEPCREALLAWKEAEARTPRKRMGRSTTYVWTGPTGQPISAHTAETWVHNLGERVLHERVYPHMLRHSAATHLSDNGADIRIVQHILGHENAQTTTRYANVTPARQRSVYERVMDGLQKARGWEPEVVEAQDGQASHGPAVEETGACSID
jgi:integrase/recombinase XerD